MQNLIRIGGMSLASVLVACSPETGLEAGRLADTVSIRNAEVIYDAGAYTVGWEREGEGPVNVRVTTSPDGQGGVLIGEDVTATNLTWAPEAGSHERRYFVIQPENGEAKITATRVLPLEGGRNFRDLGGYETVDGQRVKWGVAYRSGVMHGLTDADYDYLSGLGIAVICDLRAAQERAEQPTEWRAGALEYITFPDPSGDEDMSRAFASVLMAPDVTSEQVRSLFIDAYRRMHKTYAPAYAEMFDQLANGSIPLAFNCSAGKDRTGVAAALLLSALEVRRDIVVADYALSEQVVDFMAEFGAGTGEVDPDSPYAFLAQLPPDVIRPLMRTEPAYIEATLEAIEDEYGSVVAFIQSELGVDDSELARIRQRLLNQG